jgi:ribosomal protein S18 acetylase RimI-like enzyme
MITIRPGVPTDRDFVVDTARRFADFGPPPWRTAAEIVGGEVRCLDGFFDGGMQGSALLVAELDGGRAGFAFLEHQTDYFSGQRQGHLGMIAVPEAAEGRGVCRALLDAAERWAREQGYDTLSLNTFDTNARARRAYERAGFAVETVRYVKRVSRG